MNKIELNHWFIDENTISISLARFHVSINILTNNRFVFYQTIINDDKKTLMLNFYSIEDAILFAEQVVDKCHSIQEIIDKYDEKVEKEDFVIPYALKENTLSRKRRK